MNNDDFELEADFAATTDRYKSYNMMNALCAIANLGLNETATASDLIGAESYQALHSNDREILEYFLERLVAAGVIGCLQRTGVDSNKRCIYTRVPCAQ